MLRLIKSMQRYRCNALETIQTNRCIFLRKSMFYLLTKRSGSSLSREGDFRSIRKLDVTGIFGSPPALSYG